MSDDQLSAFPVDDATLDLLWTALHPGPDAERTSLWDFLTLMSQLAGSDTDAIAEVVNDGSDGTAPVHVMRDPQYTDHDVISALITEVRRLRSATPDTTGGPQP